VSVRRVVLVGAGGHGRGTLEILRARLAAGLPCPEPVAFVDDDPARAGTDVGGLPVLGPVDRLLEMADDGETGAILAIASAAAKRVLAARIEAAGIPWVSAVHPSAILGAGTSVGAGAIIGAGVVVAYDTRIGRHVTVNLNATVGHDCVLGDYSTIAPGVNVTGNVTIGEGVEIQTNATLVPGISVGNGARVGPGSVVLRDVPAGELVFGNPARKMPRPGREQRA